MVLLFPGEASTTAAGQDWPGPGSQPSILRGIAGPLRWLDTLGVRATAALGHGVGEITGLVWAGSLPGAEAAGLVAQRAAVLATAVIRRTALICLAADADSALALDPDGQLVIAAYHGPRCHVLGGPAEPVHDVARRAAERGSRRTSWMCPTVLRLHGHVGAPTWRCAGAGRCNFCSTRPAGGFHRSPARS